MTYRLSSVSTYGIRRFRQTASTITAVTRRNLPSARRTARIGGALTLCIVLAGCGLLDSIRSGWAGTKPFVQTLVAQQVITQAKADAAIKDVDDTLAKADVAEQCVNDIPGGLSGNERKVKKAGCYFQLAQDFRAILARHNIGGSVQLDRIAAIGQGFILALEQYFHRVNGTGPESAQSGDPDKQLEDAVKTRKAELKAITGH